MNLTDKSLNDALHNADKYPEITIGFAFGKRSEAEEFAKALKAQDPSGAEFFFEVIPGVTPLSYHKIYKVIFKNKSRFIISTAAGLTMFRETYNDIIFYGEKLDDNSKNIIRTYLKPYDENDLVEIPEKNNENALDIFLKGFKILNGFNTGRE